MKVAFCGIIAALSTVVLFLTGVVPVATVAMPAIAGCLLIPVVAEAGLSWGFGVYGVTTALALLLAPDREAFLIYALFFGYYPVLYALLGRVHSRVLRYGAKLALFNAAAVTEALLSIYVLGIPLETVGILGPWGPVALLALANAVFLVYDMALDGLIAQYLRRLHPKLAKLLRDK